MVIVHRTTKEEITQLAVQPNKPRSPYDDLLDEVAQGQPMCVEGIYGAPNTKQGVL